MSISKSFKHSKYEMTLDTAVPASWNIARSSLPAGGETFRERNEASGSAEKRLYYSLVGRNFFFLLQSQQVFCNTIDAFLKHFLIFCEYITRQ